MKLQEFKSEPQNIEQEILNDEVWNRYDQSFLRILMIEPAHKLKIDQNKLQNCRSNILNLVNVL
ncbi:hypothetical protein D1AOALGA4SA_6501 [Olavius algarvensis Delta 1 endosymbiont]|nr:hypothetical protein D1AOALGA4SA_6501 [Olavius algarvensis Delta 1 endosymbiont]